MKFFRLVSFFLIFSSLAIAAEKGGVFFPESKTVAGKNLVLNGIGLREATIFFVDVYAAGLYLESKSSHGKTIAASSQTKHLELHFVRDVDKEAITDAWSDSFKKNVKNLKPLKVRIDKFNGWMDEMKKGQSMIFTYQSGKGVTVTIKGELKGSIEGDDFAQVFFLTWLGDHPPNKGLRTGLLGKE
jgi:hypothetical protein